MDSIKNTLSAYTNNDRSNHKPQAGSKLSKPQISQQYPSRICFIIPGWHVSRNLNLLSFTTGVNSNVSSNKCVKIMALNLNQLQVTNINAQTNGIIERVHKVAYCQWYAQIIWLGKLSWNFRRTRRQSVLLIPSINCMVTKILESPVTQHYREHLANLCLAEIWFTILPSEQTGIQCQNENRTL
jgi:hypothetical protein